MDIRGKNLVAGGARKRWRAMQHEKLDIARYTVERLMRQLGIQGIRCGKTIKTTKAHPTDECPLDKVHHQIWASRSNELWGPN